MPSTSGFEVVAELTRGVLVQAVQGAWDNSVIPHSVPIAAGTPFGPYQVAAGTVNIPRAQLDLELVPATNRVRAVLGTNVQVEIANPPVPSARFFDMTTRTELDLSVGTLPSSINVGVLLSQITRGEIKVTITSGDPVAPLTMGLIAEYVHARYVDNTIPHSVTQTGVSLGFVTADAYLEIFDDAADPARRITVGPGASPNTVKIGLPTRLRLSNISNPSARSPMAVVATIAINAPLQVVPGNVTAQLSAATVAIEGLGPAPGPEGQNYSLNLTGMPSLAGLLTTQLQIRGQAVVAEIGDIVVAVPTVSTIETFIGDQTFDAVRGRGDISIWTPQTGDADVQVRDVQAKVLAAAIAFCINAGGGANANGITDFIPPGKSCAVAIDGAKVLAIIHDAIRAPESEGGFGSNFPPKTFPDIQGRRVRLNSLNPSLINGFIQLKGDVTVFDAIAGSIDVDADFTAKLILKWVDTPEGQAITAELSGQPDVDIGIGAWILGLIAGLFTFGAVGVIVVIVVLSLADDLAETLGGAVIKDEVTGRVQTISAWPINLEGIGTVDSTFDNPVGIDPQSVMFPDAYVVHATFESTADALAEANGPYVVDAGAPIQFVGGPAKPDTDYAWDFGDATSVAQMSPVHTYGDDGLYVAMLTTTVNQPGGVVTRHFAAVRARNVPPVVDAGGVITIDEGEEIEFEASFTDSEWLDTHEATFFFGDDSLPVVGSISETNDPPCAVGTSRARHAYCDDGEYTLTVQVRDDDGGVGTDTRTVVVRNVAPIVDAGADLCVLPGTPITLRACFRDPGWCDTHTATWDPGDCTPVRTAAVRERHDPPEGIGTALATHVYERCGTYLATCVVTDDDGGVGEDTVVIRVVELQNADFEGGFRERREGIVANAWEPYGKAGGGRDGTGPYIANEFVVHGGQRSQGIVAPGSGRFGIRQSLCVIAGWDYQVAAWYQLPRIGEGSTARLGIDPAGGDDPNAAGITWSERGPTEMWAQLAERVTATGDAITVFLEVRAGNRGARIHLDDVEVLAEACQPAECVPPDPDPEERRCMSLGGQDPGRYEPEMDVDGFLVTSLDQQPLIVVQHGQPPGSALRIPEKGLQVTLPFTSRRVTAESVTGTSVPVHMVPIDAAGQAREDVATTPGSGHLEIETEGISWVVLSGGTNEALLVELCAERGRKRDNGTRPGPADGRGRRARKGR
jgi:hypothetical protein